MTALGIDLGGTKIAAQVFDDRWQTQAVQRADTPTDYNGLINTLAGLCHWGDKVAGHPICVGIGAAGLIKPANGNILAANLPGGNGRPLPADVSAAIGRPVTYLNDSRAFTLSEAVFGAGRNHHVVVGLILGTGVGGGVATGGALHAGASQTGGEFGHTSASAGLVAAYDLPLITCGCGRTGCIETLISGTGLARLGRLTMGRDLNGPDIIAARQSDAGAQAAWDIWCALTGDLMRNLVLTIDPDCIVLGGGLSGIPGIADDLQKAAETAQLAGFGTPPIMVAQGGDISGARGAAYAATQGAT